MKYIGPPQSGSQADTTASRNRGGQYYRNRRSPVQPRTDSQTEYRNIFGGLATNWATLTDAQRAAWNIYGSTHPRTDSLGQNISLTGLQTYIAFNSLLLVTGASAQDLPPVSDDTPYFEVASAEPLASSSFTVSVENTVPAIANFAVYASPPRSPGVTFERDFRFIDIATSGGGSVSVDIAAAYEQKFGSMSSLLGKKIFVKVISYNAGGVQSAAVVTTAVVAV